MNYLVKRVILSKDQIRRANGLYPFTGLLGSITGGSSNIYGAIGEIMVYDIFKTKFPVQHVGDIDYDMLFCGDIRVEVKTKRTTVVPRGDYNCSISDYNPNQRCDLYIFCRVDESLSVGYILGYKWKHDFFDIARYNLFGESDGDTGFTYKDNCYNLTINELEPINWDDND